MLCASSANTAVAVAGQVEPLGHCVCRSMRVWAGGEESDILAWDFFPFLSWGMFQGYYFVACSMV